jgi:hypothetical protein
LAASTVTSRAKASLLSLLLVLTISTAPSAVAASHGAAGTDAQVRSRALVMAQSVLPQVRAGSIDRTAIWQSVERVGAPTFCPTGHTAEVPAVPAPPAPAAPPAPDRTWPPAPPGGAIEPPALPAVELCR